VLASAGWLATAGAAQARPNVVLVMTDDQGYGDLSCHGNPHLKTPRIDALRGQSTALDRFYVSPTCSPTRAALMTGRHEFRCGVSHTIMGRSLLRPGIPTMAERFRAAGYRTAIVGKWHLGDNAPCRPEDRGFDDIFIHGGGGIGQTPDYWGNSYFDPMVRTLGGWRKTSGYCTDVFFAEAARWIGERAARKEPFFLYLAPNAAHSPYIPPKGANKKFLDAGVPEPAASFYAMIENIDLNMGRLLDNLDELGLAGNTVVLFLTDNGTAVPYWNAGMKGHKGSPHEGGVRVPCFIRWPGRIAAGRVVAAPCAQIDLLPTLAGLCGVDAGEAGEMDGSDLSGALLGKAGFPDGRVFFTQVGRWPGGDSPARHRGSGFAVRDSRWRLVGTELYDMSADPGERDNVFAEHGADAIRLLGVYGKWWERVLPEVSEPVRYRIGSDAQAAVRLTAYDWWPSMEAADSSGMAVYQLWDQSLIRKTLRRIKAGGEIKGGAVSGCWKLDVVRDGHYRVRMSLLPPEASGAERRELGLLRAGSAHVRVNRSEAKMPVSDRASEVTMGVDLPKGPVDLEAWFAGQLDGDAPLGAFFVEIQRTGDRKMPVPDIRAE
jgi:arylsulfatase A-like enzyme